MAREPLEEFLVVDCDPLHEETSVGLGVLVGHPETVEAPEIFRATPMHHILTLKLVLNLGRVKENASSYGLLPSHIGQILQVFFSLATPSLDINHPFPHHCWQGLGY